jgi:signal transduction histidine kinase
VPTPLGSSQGRNRPFRPLPFFLTAAVVAGAGLLALAPQPPRLYFTPFQIAGAGHQMAAVDMLGICQNELLDAFDNHLLLSRFVGSEQKAEWQHNCPRERGPFPAMDVTGDGLDKICLSERDSAGATVVVIDRQANELLRLGPVSGPRTPAGTPWDGWLVAAAPLEQGGRRKLVCLLLAGYAREPRGLALYDVASGKQDWFFPMGGAPGATCVADLDGDGKSEVLTSTVSPGNGADRNGTDDLHCYALALGMSGQRRWQVTLCGDFAHTAALVLPGTAGNPARVVATVNSHRALKPEPGRVIVLDGRSGQELARREYTAGMGWPRLLPGEGGSRFVVGGNDGVVRSFDASLEPLRTREVGAPVEVWDCVDVDGCGQAEALATTPGEVLVLDGRLAVRARFTYAAGQRTPSQLFPLRAGPARWRLCVVGEDRAVMLDLRSVPPLRDPRMLGGVLGIALLSGAGAGVLASLTRRRPPRGGAAARDFLIDYHQIYHDTFGAERPFARIRLWAQAEAAGHPLPVETLASAYDEFRRLGSLSLTRFAERARTLGVDRRRAAAILGLTRTVERTLAQALPASADARSSLLATALAAIAELSRESSDAYREVALADPCHASLEAGETMFAKREGLMRMSITTEHHFDPAAAKPALFDRLELRLVVGEILENAMRALSGVPEPAVRITITEHPTDPRWLVLRVIDNGPGIPVEEREAIFAPGTSARPGGGFGLHRAREMVRSWLGDLVVEDPPQGRGTVMKLTLRVLLPHEPAAAGDFREHGS